VRHRRPLPTDGEPNGRLLVDLLDADACRRAGRRPTAVIILPDVNVLVYAFRKGAEQHEPYRSWLDELLDSQEDLLLVEAVLVSVVRDQPAHRRSAGDGGACAGLRRSTAGCPESTGRTAVRRGLGRSASVRRRGPDDQGEPGIRRVSRCDCHIPSCFGGNG